jgi:hypothetical protein
MVLFLSHYTTTSLMQLQKEKIIRVRVALVSLQAFRARLPAIGHFRTRDHAPHLRQRALVPARAGGQAAHRRCRCRLGVQGASPRSHAARPRVSGRPRACFHHGSHRLGARERCRTELTFPPPSTAALVRFLPRRPRGGRIRDRRARGACAPPNPTGRRTSRAPRPPLSDRSRVHASRRTRRF